MAFQNKAPRKIVTDCGKALYDLRLPFCGTFLIVPPSFRFRLVVNHPGETLCQFQIILIWHFKIKCLPKSVSFLLDGAPYQLVALTRHAVYWCCCSSSSSCCPPSSSTPPLPPPLFPCCCAHSCSEPGTSPGRLSPVFIRCGCSGCLLLRDASGRYVGYMEPLETREVYLFFSNASP